MIATHKRPDHLRVCLASCEAQSDIAKEIVVVLNPPDRASELVVKGFNVKTIRTHRNLGAFPAKSLGIANSRAPYVMVVDDDAKFLAADDVRRMLQTLIDDPLAAAVTCNTVGPREGQPAVTTQAVPVYKDGFTLYRRSVFDIIVGFVPDTFFRAGAETYYANYIYDSGYTVVLRHDVAMFHAQTAIGRSRSDMNRFAVRNHALLVLLQEPAAIVLFSLVAKVLSSGLRIAILRRDPANWLFGWLSFLACVPFGLVNRRAVSWTTYRRLRQMRRKQPEAGSPPISLTGDGNY